ncbi:MAG: hypoxanthine phosphoribosyltransferase [Myxococcales bacterium]|nr:hypoxanthine phosphoribosyltransferase [Myxococcales bacterium]
MGSAPTPFIDAERLSARIAEMGHQIRATYGPDETITAVAVLKGSIVFFADLLRSLPGPVTCDFLGLQSYEGTVSSGAVRITHDLRADIAGKHVLVVEDIVDTGLTLDYLHRTLGARNPASLRVATLLDKPSRRRVDVRVDWVGFTIEDRFVVGFGLDHDQMLRNLPYIGTLDDSP